MKTTQFMRKPFVVAAVQVTEDNMAAVAKWCQGHIIADPGEQPFIRVPVDRPTNQRQTRAYVQSWVTVSRTAWGARSFKVFSEDHLTNNFIELQAVADEDLFIEDPTPTPTNVSSCCNDHEHAPAAPVRPVPSQGGGTLGQLRSVNFRQGT